MIIFAESMLNQPSDRKYYEHGGARVAHPEILGDGYSYCVIAGRTGYVILKEQDNVQDERK